MHVTSLHALHSLYTGRQRNWLPGWAQVHSRQHACKGLYCRLVSNNSNSVCLLLGTLCSIHDKPIHACCLLCICSTVGRKDSWCSRLCSAKQNQDKPIGRTRQCSRCHLDAFCRVGLEPLGFEHAQVTLKCLGTCHADLLLM